FIEPAPNWDADRTSAVQCDLPPAVEKAKLENLTDLFESKFNCKPLSFRAGRFGISRFTFSYLSDLGYLVDSSVTPFKTHYYETGTINNFWGATSVPYRVFRKNLIQVPVTIINKDFAALPMWVLGF